MVETVPKVLNYLIHPGGSDNRYLEGYFFFVLLVFLEYRTKTLLTSVQMNFTGSICGMSFTKFPRFVLIAQNMVDMDDY